MFDTHLHLTFPDYRDRVAESLAEARAAGVTGAITISTTTQDCLNALALAEQHASANLYCSAGIHPLYSHVEPRAWENLLKVVRSPRCVAWGEMGLDYHYEGPHRATQHGVLEEQLAFIANAKREHGIDKPIVIHCREAFDELIPILKESGFDPARFVFHCFTAGPREMRLLLDFGAMVSFTGVVTYKNAAEVQEAAKIVPRDRFMIETDAPFLSPTPHRGVRPNQPKFARVTAEFVADLRGEQWDDFHAQINRNTERFFGLEHIE
jgi:TatD DNase family protein